MRGGWRGADDYSGVTHEPMRIFHAVAAIAVVIATQATNTTVHIPVAAQLGVQRAEAASTPVHVLSLNTQAAKPIQVIDTRPSFDDAVGTPLKAAQVAAKAAAEAKLAQAKQIVLKATPVIIGGTDAFAQLRFCEAGGDYAKNTGNGYFGAYQYDISTWANYGGFARPDLAPPAVQDAKAHETQSRRGWNPWPACARKLGLL